MSSDPLHVPTDRCRHDSGIQLRVRRQASSPAVTLARPELECLDLCLHDATRNV